MTSWFERMVEGTRGQLLVMLRRSKRSINDLAAALGISDNAVRMHVAALQRDGMVESAGTERPTGGKPAQLFQITAAAEELFPKAYALVLGEMIRVLEDQQGRDAVVALLRDVGARAAASHRNSLLSLEGRVQQAAGLLRDLGGDVEVERRDGEWVIQGYGCPLSAVARGHSEVCCLAESLVAEITGAPTSKFCVRGERPRCAFRIAEGAAQAVQPDFNPAQNEGMIPLPSPSDPAPVAANTDLLHDIRSRDDIARLIDAFYTKAIDDEVIGYIFTDVAKLDLKVHLPIMYDFWESLLLGGRSYKGGAMQKHIDLDRMTRLEPEHFQRWLLLFETTVNDFFVGDIASSAILASQNIARSMSQRLEGARRRASA